ncbi:hypothetical protein NDI85_08340 [Halomicroarcula sp. S1AR25-4]|uniref:LVIVD repeat-containing protein n=1 Tax=Haloarcula sp. S1AR25-4 TaxID=2950538 RepID=UPI0028751B5E|nr:hypothetical protein [Halomicroarcula sp. S1AR25-4]MDS0277801.1 hypothetical protein [Halomicroarcula sp. S1AR25-4]
MYRRTFLRRVGAAGVGAAAVTGAASGHPTPTDDGTARTPAGTPTGRDTLGTLDLPGAHELVTSPDGHTAYVATGTGVAVVDVTTPTNPRRITHRTDLLADSAEGPMEEVQDLALRGDRLLVAGPAHPAEGAHGLVVFDVTDRQSPDRVVGYEVDTVVHNCDFDGRYAYLTANSRAGNPLLVVDTETEREAGTWSLFDADEAWRDVPGSLRPLHDVWVHGDRAYLAYWDAGTWILDVSDPADVSLVSRVRGRDPAALADVESPSVERSEPPGNDHFVTVNEDATLLGVGSESWDLDDDGSGGPSGIELFDVTDETAPESVATIGPPPTSDPTPGGVLTTAHNFELTDGRCYAAWYNGGVTVHDVRDPASPREVFAWRDSETTSFWTAQRGAGCFLAANTNANAGSAVTPGVYAFPDPRLGAPTDETDSATGGGVPIVGAAGDGFGVAAALAAVGLAAWRLRR